MKINIHAGHNPDGRTACGAVGLLKESTEARLVKNKVISYLKELGHTVYDCTVDNGSSQYDVLTKIVGKCNSHTVDLDISIHFNSGRNDAVGDGSIGGTEIWIYHPDSAASRYAKTILERISALGFRNRGIKISKDLYVLANTKAEALLIECCFVDDKDDVSLYNAGDMAKAIVTGITGQSVSIGSAGSVQAPGNHIPCATVKDFTKWLNSYLKINLPLDNTFDESDKKAAITAFQRMGGIPATGCWGMDSIKLTNQKNMHIRLGNNGNLVKLLQGMLIVNGIYFGELHGIYDLNTTNTVLHFQKYWNLNPHGIAGTQVWKKLLG
ncbi:MAG: hypothetical protein HFI34_10730 [Lachnospiraceae bacterium]|nr:hypothetical protein [Lachnospiraceae bacterium]